MDLELIVFKMENRYFGIDSSEVIKVSEFQSEENTLFLEGNEKPVFAHTLLEYSGQYTYQTSLLIRPQKMSRVIVHIPYIDDFLIIKEVDIIPLPDFMKKKQHPFLVWGVSEQQEKLIILITFDYYFE